MERLKPGDRVSIRLSSSTQTGTVVSDGNEDRNPNYRLVKVILDGRKDKTSFCRFRFKLLSKLEQVMK